MSRKRRREPEELPLFDFPLDHPATAGEPAEEARDDRSATKAPETRADEAITIEPESTASPPEVMTGEASSPPPAQADEAPFQPSLFAADPSAQGLTEEDGHAQVDLQLDTPPPDDTAPFDEAPEPTVTVGDRLLAGVADIAVHVVMMGTALGAVIGLGVPLTTQSWPAFAVLALAFSFLYWVVPLAFWGQTPGMAWIGHITRGAEDEPLSFGQTIRRWIGAWLTVGLAGLPLLLGLGGRSLSDRLSGTDTHSV